MGRVRLLESLLDYLYKAIGIFKRLSYMGRTEVSRIPNSAGTLDFDVLELYIKGVSVLSKPEMILDQIILPMSVRQPVALPRLLEREVKVG